MITRKVAPALAASYTVVLKPAEESPLTALAAAELARRVGVPAGVLNIVPTGHPEPVGTELTSNPTVRKISFTGSVDVVKRLMRDASGTVKNISLELGGNAPFIVFDDADVDAAVEGAIASKYRNSGQTCICADRVLVQDGVYEEFAKRLADAVAALPVGQAIEDETAISSLVNQAALDKVEELVEDARVRGAQLMTGGRRHALGRTFYEVTVLTDVTPDMRIWQVEIFGPVAPLYRFSTGEDAIATANHTPYGVAAYFYAGDLGRIWRVGEGIEAGMVGVNTDLISTEPHPFGGVKESGMGPEGSHNGLEEYLELKYLCMGGI